MCTPPAIRAHTKTAVPKLGKIFVGDWNDDVGGFAVDAVEGDWVRIAGTRRG